MEIKVNEYLTIVDEIEEGCAGCECGKYTHVVQCENGQTYRVCEDCFKKHFVQCAYCGKYILTSRARRVGADHLCYTCFDQYFTWCSVCGQAIKRSDAHETAEGKLICDDCVRYYEVCPVCGKLTNYTVHTEVGDLCSACATNEGYAKCSICGEWHKLDDMTEYGDKILCEDCASASTWTCAHCGAAFYDWEDDACEIFNETVCARCYDELSYIDGYGHTATNKRYRAPGESPTKKYLGMELEMESSERNNDDMVAHIRFACPDIPAHIKSDGSLSNGAEFAFYPATRKYLTEVFPLDDFCQTARDVGAVSHDSKRCGLHVHVSRAFFSASKLAYAKLCIMLDRIWDNLVVFSRRDYDQIDDWAKKNDVSYESIETTLAWNAGDRYLAINDTNSDTIEFRVFRGSLIPDTIRATLEFVDIFTDYAETHSIEECCKLKWDNLFENASDTFRKYCLTRDIEMS